MLVLTPLLQLVDCAVPCACRVKVTALALAVLPLGVPIASHAGADVPMVNAVPPTAADVTETVCGKLGV